MEDVDNYREIVKTLIREYAGTPPAHGEVETEMIFDDRNDHYELVYSGWRGPRRIHGAVIHIDIREGKLWIQHDGTPDGLADLLVAQGVPKDRIVLAYKAPNLRRNTGFAVA